MREGVTEHFQHFLAEMKASFWGDVYGQTKRVWKQFLEADSQSLRRPLCGAGGVPAAAQPAAALSQRLLPTGFRDPGWDHPAAHCTHPRKSFLPRGIARFQRRGTKWRHNTCGFIRRTGTLSLGRLG